MANKYIYEVYKASDNRFNVEQRTIVYENSEYVYFKYSGNNKELGHIPVNKIRNSIGDIDKDYFDNYRSYWGHEFIWNYDNNKDKKILDERCRGSWIGDARNEIERLKYEISHTENELSKKKNSLNNLKDRLDEWNKRLKELLDSKEEV